MGKKMDEFIGAIIGIFLIIGIVIVLFRFTMSIISLSRAPQVEMINEEIILKVKKGWHSNIKASYYKLEKIERKVVYE